LARLEAVIAFQRLFARFPQMQLKAPARIAKRLRFREVEELRVTVT
jgi:cytochrome P450